MTKSLVQTAGDLLLQLEQLDITLSIDFLERTKSFLGPDARDRVFEQHQLFLLDSQGMDRLNTFYEKVKQGGDPHFSLLYQCEKLLIIYCHNFRHQLSSPG